METVREHDRIYIQSEFYLQRFGSKYRKCIPNFLLPLTHYLVITFTLQLTRENDREM